MKSRFNYTNRYAEFKPDFDEINLCNKLIATTYIAMAVLAFIAVVLVL